MLAVSMLCLWRTSQPLGQAHIDPGDYYKSLKVRKAHGNHPVLLILSPGMLVDQWLLLIEPLVLGFSLSFLPQDHFPTEQLHATPAVPLLSLPYVPEGCDSDVAYVTAHQQRLVVPTLYLILIPSDVISVPRLLH